MAHGLAIVQAGARIEAGTQVIGPVMVNTGAVFAADAFVRDRGPVAEPALEEIAVTRWDTAGQPRFPFAPVTRRRSSAVPVRLPGWRYAVDPPDSAVR